MVGAHLYNNVMQGSVGGAFEVDFYAQKSSNTTSISDGLREIATAMKDIDDLEQRVGPLDQMDASQIRKLVIQQRRTAKSARELFPEELTERQIKDALVLRDENQGAKAYTAREVENLAGWRERCFFLTGEDESWRGTDLLTFDMQRLLDNGFKITEANIGIFRQPQAYFDSLRPITSPEEQTPYTVTHPGMTWDDDPLSFSTQGGTKYDPFCPEYLVSDPSWLFDGNEDDWSEFRDRMAEIKKRNPELFAKERFKGSADPKDFLQNERSFIAAAFQDAVVSVKEGS